jgi:hypothetical protein
MHEIDGIAFFLILAAQNHIRFAATAARNHESLEQRHAPSKSSIGNSGKFCPGAAATSAPKMPSWIAIRLQPGTAWTVAGG